MKSANELKTLLKSIDRKSYPAYKSVKGSYNFGSFILNIDHVQGDPFASPSKLRIVAAGEKAGFPEEYYQQSHQQTALEDHLTRRFYQELGRYNFSAKGSGKSGLLSVSCLGQEVLARTACEMNPQTGSVTLRLEAGFPANGRTINATQLIRMLFEFLPVCAEKSLYYQALDKNRLKTVIDLAEDQHFIREQLKKQGLTAFVADGSVLPRDSGVSQKPMKNGIPFQSPDSMRVTMSLPHRGEITGMGIKAGITLIVGGGYHGKSTLLRALELGVYNHIGGDGREYVITDDTALKIRAEDGRSIKKTDISMFINNLPNGKDTKGFCTEDASGSTSQAANVIEGLESGTDLLLIDEDTSATNFMIRDELMQRVVHRDQEPITPFIERARWLYEEKGISSVIVAGSSGAYFHIADCILQMDQYVPKDITAFAKKEAAAFPMQSEADRSQIPEYPAFDRIPKPVSRGKDDYRNKIKTGGRDVLLINKETIDLRCVEQLVDSEQTAALGYILLYAKKNLFDSKKSMQEILAEIRKRLEQQGLSAFAEGSSPSLAAVRDQEILACLNRYRSLNL